MKHWTSYIWGNEVLINVVSDEIDSFLIENKFNKIIKKQFESKILNKFENPKAKEILIEFLRDSDRVFSLDNYTEDEMEEDEMEEENDITCDINCDILIRENAILVIMYYDNSLSIDYHTLLIEDMQLKEPKELSYLISKIFSDLSRSL